MVTIEKLIKTLRISVIVSNEWIKTLYSRLNLYDASERCDRQVKPKAQESTLSGKGNQEDNFEKKC